MLIKGMACMGYNIKNIIDIHRMYGLTNAKRRKQLIDKFSHILMMQCTIDE